MSQIAIDLPKQFSDTPGGRYRARSEKSGEEFRDDVLRPALKKADFLFIEMNGASGYPHSFLDESFGKIIDEIGIKEFHRRIKWNLTDNAVALRRLEEVIRKHSAG